MPGQIDSQTTNFKGILRWEAFTQPYGSVARPAVEIELFIKEHSIPTRKKLMNETNTVGMTEPSSEMETATSILVEGAPELLSVEISGTTHTPVVGGLYQPRDISGTPIAEFQGLTYTELIAYYIEGRLNLSIGEAFQRKDPDYFISPYGQKYLNPVISVFDMQGSPIPQEHTFSATLLLER